MFLPPFSWLAVVIFWVLCLFFFRYVVQSLSEVTLQQQSHLFTLDTQTRQLRIHKPKGDTVIDIEEIRYFLSWRRHDEEATGAETALRVITRRRNQVLLTTDRPTEFARLLGFLCKKPAYERAYPGKHQLLRYAQEEEALLLPASAPAPLQEELLRPAAERAEAGPEQLLRPTVPEGDL